MNRIAFAALAVLAFACEVNTGEDGDDGLVGGAGGTTSSGGSGASSGTGATGGSNGSVGGSSAMGGTSGAAGGSGGVTGGTGGGASGKGGTAGEGGEPSVGGSAGMSAGGSASGSGGTGTAGSAGTTGCAANVRCTLEPPASTGDPAQDCVNRINQFRAECACLPPLARWTEGEACADEMAEYDSVQDSAHAGFQDDVCEGGSAQNECPGWRSEDQVVDGCLQAMWDEGPPPTENCSGSCFQEYGHFINMTNTRYTKVACGFYTTPGGEVWAVQNFTR